MKILVIGYYYSRNLGDAVICDCVAARLRRAYPDAEIKLADIWGRTAFPEKKKRTIRDVEKRYGFLRTIGAVSRYTPVDLEWIREQRTLAGSGERMERVAAADCDAVVFAGGQLLMDWFSVGVSWYIRKFAERGIPVLINAGGTGPEYSPKIRKLFSDSLMNPDVVWISSRDRSGYVTGRYLRDGKKCVSVSDPALWTDETYQVSRENTFRPAAPARQAIYTHDSRSSDSGMKDPAESRSGPDGTGRKISAENADSRQTGLSDCVGLGMILPYNMNYRVLSRFWTGMIRFLEEKKIPWKIILNGADTDELFAETFLAESGMSPEQIREKLLPVPREPAQLAEQIASLRGLISFRLHSHVMAASLNTPSVAVVWDRKVRSFFRRIGHPERCLTLRDSPEAIWRAFEKAEREGYDRRRILMQREYSEQMLLRELERVIRADC